MTYPNVRSSREVYYEYLVPTHKTFPLDYMICDTQYSISSGLQPIWVTAFKVMEGLLTKQCIPAPPSLHFIAEYLYDYINR